MCKMRRWKAAMDSEHAAKSDTKGCYPSRMTVIRKVANGKFSD